VSSVTASETESRANDAVRLLASVFVLGVFAFVAWKIGLFKPEAAEKVSAESREAGGLRWIVPSFILVYAGVAALALPVGPLAYGAGAVFGFVRGSIYVWIASMIAAVAGYYLASDVWAKPARRLLGRQGEKLTNLNKGNVALTAFRMQLMPLVPFGVFNYAAAISKLPILPFLLGTAFGIIPGTLLATYVGDRFIAGMRGEDKQPLYIALGVTLVLMGLSFLPKLFKKTRDA
jgi:uncharacterized membrane protein YdjX (TVP38/TMEM64 family)